MRPRDPDLAGDHLQRPVLAAVITDRRAGVVVPDVLLDRRDVHARIEEVPDERPAEVVRADALLV